MKKTLLLAACLLLVLSCGCSKPQPVENPVKVDLWVMSECPYGTHAEGLISKVKNTLGPLVDPSIYFIVDQDEEGNLASLHGQPELDRNIVQACVGELYPEDQLNFILAWNGAPETDYKNLAAFYKLDSQKIDQCITEGRGREIIVSTIPRKKELGITGSPTIYLDGKEFEEHRSSLGLVDAICAIRTADPDFKDTCRHKPASLTYTDASLQGQGSCGPGQAAGQPAMDQAGPDDLQIGFFSGIKDKNPLEIIVIEDKTIQAPYFEQIKSLINKPLPKAKIRTVSFPSPEADKLIRKHKIQWLPAMLFEDEFAKSPIYKAAKGLFNDVGGMFVANPVHFGATRKISRPLTENTLDIYYLPFDQASWQVIPVIAEAITAPQVRKKTSIIRLLPALSIDEDFSKQIEQGDEKAQEAMRQAVVASAYPDKLAAYLTERFKDLNNADWSAAAVKAGIVPEEISEMMMDDQVKKQVFLNSVSFDDLGVLVNLAFVKNNQELRVVGGKEQFDELINSLP